MSTTTTPATAIAAIFSRVTLSGGAVRLLARLRLSRTRNITLASTTATAVTIQLASGLRAPPSMSDRTLLYSRMLPPPLGAADCMTSSSRPSASS